MKLVTFLLLVLHSQWLCSNAQTPGEYPPIRSVASYRPVTSTSVCGVNNAEDFCRYTRDTIASLAPNCIRETCNNTCPFSSTSPSATRIALLGTLGSGVSATEGRPDSSTGALQFQNSFISVPPAQVPAVGDDGFSFAVWVNQEAENIGTLISKSSSDGQERNYALILSETNITFDYLPQNLDTSSLAPGIERYRTVVVSGLLLDPNFWHHVTLTVFGEDAVFYINGSVVSVQALEGSVRDNPARSVLLGQLYTSVGSFNGLMQDVSFYGQALTAREVTEVYTGTFPSVHLSSECRCPPSHPQIDPSNGAICIQYPGGNLVPRGSVSRINSLAHPAGFINDFGTFNGWISAPGDRNVNITLRLTDFLYELIFVNINFGSPRPKAAVLEASSDSGITYRPIQYYADDCMMYFNLPDNGAIVNADDVNCITSQSLQLPLTSIDIRTRLLDPQVRNFDLNTSPELRDFISASHLRLRLVDLFTSSTTTQHQYYSILEITIAARCACNGHSSRCDSEIDSTCQCLHNTEGPNCERCHPLYNDKPWRYGTTNNAFPCKLCECNNHATRCYYNESVDLNPTSYDVGGGGVCIDCQDNTAGRQCDSCAIGFFRPTGRLPSDPSPCESCNCNTDGVSDGGDCAKSDDIGGVLIGQCNCKPNVLGLKCDACLSGFFGLSISDPNGCRSCECNTNGTFDGSTTCQNDGRCLCKQNVGGLKCDECQSGFTDLRADNPLGCSPCGCNPVGSASLDCRPDTGRCTCLPGVGGLLCDQCLPGFFGFSASGCQPCECDVEGSLNSNCDSVTGECDCRNNVMGAQCDSCVSGFYDLSINGCIECNCNTNGTVNGSNVCDSFTGLCDCKTNVAGDTCDSCLTGFTNLLEMNEDGCLECDCVMPNTNTSGNICDPITSQCDCLPSAMGLTCDTCQSGYYLSGSECVLCDCDVSGSAPGSLCDSLSGICDCANDGVGGVRCDTCRPGFFQFPSCQSCGCNLAGSQSTLCNNVTGECVCKDYVTGLSCDQCIPGFQILQASNPFGCSANPDEQAPPDLISLSATSIQLTWFQPEAPNGLILGYRIYRNGVNVANVTGLNYTDEGLEPDTSYSYFIEAFNVVGTTQSVAVSQRTLEGVPTGVSPPTLQALNSTSVRATWLEPTDTNGIISRYELVMVDIDLGDEQVVFAGFGFSGVVSDLMPFTTYSFLVRACTSGGCGSSQATQVQTLEAPPSFQPAPNVTTVNSTSLMISWDFPSEPNGVVTQYDVRQRNLPFTGNGVLVETVSNTTLSLLVMNLRPFISYEFSVVSYTGGGSTQSEWSDGITAEDIPDDIVPPVLTPISSSEIHISWSLPGSPNGIVLRYGVYRLRESQNTLEFLSDSPGNFTVSGLMPFTEYSFILEVCTSIGCMFSTVVSTLTLETVPIGQLPPMVNQTTATSVLLEWDGPIQPNGIISSYTVQRRRPSLSPSPSLRDVGTSFDGNNFATFLHEDGNLARLGGLMNTITISFRTFSSTGTLLYYINAARVDFLALELRDGIPWFFFDPGRGAAVAVPDVADGVRFNDGEWHTVVAVQNGRSGSVTVDETYTGVGESPSGAPDRVISSNQTIYIGGIPNNLPRSTMFGAQSPNTTLNGDEFTGCLFGIFVNGEPLDFLNMDDSSNINPNQGCPIVLIPGWSFLGGGYLSYPANTISSSRFSWLFDVRTTDNQGLVFFASSSSGESSLGVEIRDSYLRLVVTNMSTVNTASVGSQPICDGQWHAVLLEKSDSEIFLGVDGQGTALPLADSNIVFSSEVFFGGVPLQASSAYTLAGNSGLNVFAPFSGCMRAMQPPSPVQISNSLLVRYDGCFNGSTNRGSSSCGAPWENLDAGRELMYTDRGLVPFTEHLYRIGAANSAGQALSGWSLALTEESVPDGVGMVTLVTLTDSTLTVTWLMPVAPNGLITRYNLSAAPTFTTGLDTILGDTVTTSLDVDVPEQELQAVLVNLVPATVYEVTLTAYTSAGGASGPAAEIATDESVPIDVQAPMVNLIEARRLGLYWDPPLTPNGVITRYELFVDGELVFTGAQNSTFVDSLNPFTEYSFFVQACTRIGCTNSSSTIGQTLPDVPMGVFAPNLTVLSPSSIEVSWEAPEMPNGIILRYELRRLSQSTFVVDFSGLDFETTVTGLQPNTLYSFQLLVFNGGGSTASSIVSETTLEDIPDGIVAPEIEIINSTSLRVTWSVPSRPNGDIIQYILLENGTAVFSGTSLSYIATNLEPFTYYSYSIMACTVRGCGSSNRSTSQTSEAIPEGYIEPNVTLVTPFSITLLINPVMNPNGIIQYVLFVSDSIEATSSDVVFNSSIPSTVEVPSLNPFTDYFFILEVSNGAGELVGPPFMVQTLPSIPAGVLAPDLTLLDATTIQVDSLPPLMPNGIIQSYQLTLTDGVDTIVIFQDLNTTTQIYDLTPFTTYQVVVTVTNTEGSADSPPANITTGETAPEGFDQIVALQNALGPRHIVISWDPPAVANGIIVNYTVIQGGRIIAAIPPSSLEYNVTSLLPFTSYNFSVMACTSAGCVESPSLIVMTLEDVPEDVLAPIISSVVQTVIISWSPPLTPNGVILEYRIERALNGSANFTVVGSLNATAESLSLVDTATDPFTSYEYRVVAENSAGFAVGPVTEFTTPEAAPEDVQPPLLTTLSATSINIQFISPLTPNGIITMYTITRLTPLTTFTFTPSTLPALTPNGYFSFNDSSLVPFTDYSYTLRVCTNGGCTVSEPAVVTTFEAIPTQIFEPDTTLFTLPEGQEGVQVSWIEPGMPNSDALSYLLFQKTIGFSLEELDDVNCCEEYVMLGNTVADSCRSVVSSYSEDTFYADFDVFPFTFYQYCIVVNNSAGSTFSNLSSPIQTNPAPTPLVGPELNASTVNSTAIELSWGSLDISELLGPFNEYILYQRVSGTPGLGVEIFRGSSQMFTAVDLIASTEYTFVVGVSNGRGIAFGNNATEITDEGIPADLPPPFVEAVSSESLSITIFEPLQPNGVIILYTISLFDDISLVFNQSDSGELIVNGLQPYTVYTAQVRACTQFGCTDSPLVSGRTLESAPVDLASPVVEITGPRSARITWSPPITPNGNITEYQLSQQEGGGEPMVVFSGIDFQFITPSLQPFTTYFYRVTAINSAGNVSSILTRATTQEAPPTSIDAPKVISLSETEIMVSWFEPDELNGMLQGYQIYRDGALLSSTFGTTFVDDSLEPFTAYSYIVEVCTNGGCTNSSVVSNTTFEALPETVSEIIISDLSARSFVLSWQQPLSSNGILTEYILTFINNNTILFRGLALSYSLSDLTPFTVYTFALQTCNSRGCVDSNQTNVLTLEAAPEGFASPRLRNLTSASVAIEWMAPTLPNGNITTYILRRGNDSFPDQSIIIFQGLNFSFNDGNLVADTQYFYTVEAVNGGGSFETPPSFFRTVADLAEVDPPTVTVLGSTSIRITWSEPARPNGVISNYMLFMNDVQVISGIVFEFTASNLTPFTVHSFYLAVCNQAGCASSITVTVVTDAAPPTGIAPPSLDVLSSTAIQVSWSPPISPNGLITQYEVRRRILNDPLSETIQHLGGPSILSFPNSGLEPFTTYEYRVRVHNTAGSTFSEWVNARTLEDIPAEVSLPVIADSNILSRNITVSWSPPGRPNGIILAYRLEYRLPLDPLTNQQGVPIIAAQVSGDTTTATATGLSPITIYEFRIVAINGAGEGVGDFVTVTTREDVPEEIQPIIIEERFGTSLVLTWSPPRIPNGAIQEYRLFVDGGLVYRDSPPMYTVLRLQPFTNYSLQLAACTLAGCTFGDVQSERTAEVAPFGQPSPNVVAITSRSVEVMWSPPAQPNGIIISYEILRQENSLSSTLEVIARTTDTLNRRYVDNNVQPAMDYQYAVRAINSISQTDSDFRPIRTPEDAPEGFSPAVLTVLSSSSIQVSWFPPARSNGVLLPYVAYRTGGGIVNLTVYENQNRGFTDVGLLPFTSYSYVIQACTSGGCVFSEPSSLQTSEAVPTGLAPPSATALTESIISIQWTPPQTPNGIITSYVVSVLPISIIIMTNDLARNVTNLQPFTSYNVRLEACNSAGCIQSSTDVQTLESLPEFITPPRLTAINSSAILVTWSAPLRPNGVIINYELRRNGTLVFSGTEITFTDAGLAPNQFYSYTVQAYTSIGAGEESAPPSINRTLPDTPDGVLPPSLQPTSSNSIRATWTAPISPNGVIQRYVLLVNGNEVFTGLGLQYDALNLEPFTSYDFSLMACTTTCASSTVVSAVTLEAPPLNQSPPTLIANTNTTVSVSWNAPNNPNGVIISYEVERRQGGMSSFSTVFNGLATQFLDNVPLLRPATMYEYRVTARNGAGSVTSTVMSVTLLDAAPGAVPTPTIEQVTSMSLTVVVSAPLVPNGVLTEYRLYQNGTQVGQEVPATQTTVLRFPVTGLRPFTAYGFNAEVCTSAGCTESSVITEITGEAPPASMAPPTGMSLTPRSVNINWAPPSEPNGVILRYSVYYRTACPRASQPRLVNQPTCVAGPRTLIASGLGPEQLMYVWNGNATGTTDPIPYTSYEFQVVVENNAGSTTSAYSEPNIITQSTAPVVIGSLSLRTDQENQVIYLNWTDSFLLNGVLQHYTLTRNNLALLQSADQAISLTTEPRGTSLVYVVTVETRFDGNQIGRISTDEIETVLGGVSGTSGTQPSTTAATPTTSSTGSTPFYQEVAFITGMVVLAVIIATALCVLILCCLRPKADSKKYHVRSPADLELDHSPERKTPPRKNYSKLSTPNPERTTGSWSPGEQLYSGEIPTLDDDVEPLMVSPPKGRSYSPRKMEFEDDVDPRVSVLTDTDITSTSRAPPLDSDSYHYSVKDDFGTFKTTFADTKV